MKLFKNSLLLLVLIIPITLQAQSDQATKKNEIGTDITSLIEQIFNFEQSQFINPYSATYQLTYKRHFKEFSIRTAIGGSSNSRERDSQVSDEKLKSSSEQFNYRIGLEQQMKIGKRWRFFYGLDFRQSIFNSREDFNNQNGGWRYGSNRKRKTVALSPFFGIDFKISEQISLQTETNFILYSFKSSNQPTVTQISDTPSIPMPSTEKEVDNENGTAFNVPNFLNLTVRF